MDDDGQEILESQDSQISEETGEAAATAQLQDAPELGDLTPAEGGEVREQLQDAVEIVEASPAEGDEDLEQPQEAGEIGEVEPAERDDAETPPAEAAPTEEPDSSEAEGEGVAEAAKPEPPPDAEWFVIHSYSGYENKVQRNLEQRIETMAMQDRIFRVVVPTEEEVEIRDGQRRTVRKRLFPGYIFVQMIMDDDSWYVVRNTPAVTGFVSSGSKVGSGSRPAPISDEEVEKILSRMETEQPRIKVSFRAGETVRITEGPFADFMAVVDELYPDRGKVRLLVSFFGRETPVEMDFLQVESI